MSSIVQEWVPKPSPPPAPRAQIPIDQLPPEEARKWAADNYGIERPQGYTVSFHFNPAVESFHFGKTHPMKPWRLTLTKQLVLSFGLQFAMDLYVPPAATKDIIACFHSDDYLDFLSSVTPKDKDSSVNKPRIRQFNFGDDCPVFDGMWEYCSLYTGSTMNATHTLMTGKSDIAISWSGGLHHAKKKAASGFCYINDIVVAIQELLRKFPRVLYIDIDVHHGDGVEQAFWSSPRVLTISYHKYDPEQFFPGTGGAHETGPERPNPGSHFSLNCPLLDGISDDQYISLFKDTITECFDVFRPPIIVLQCGADSLGGDRLGRFNLNIAAHGACVDFVKSLGVPLLILGGGGYTPRNVARAWCHETSLSIGIPRLSRRTFSGEDAMGGQYDDSLPPHVPTLAAFAGEANGSSRLYPALDNVNHHTNMHTEKYLNGLRNNIHTQLLYLHGHPVCAMDEIPANWEDLWDRVMTERRDHVEDDMDGIEAEAGRHEKEENVGGRSEHRFKDTTCFG